MTDPEWTHTCWYNGAERRCRRHHDGFSDHWWQVEGVGLMASGALSGTVPLTKKTHGKGLDLPAVDPRKTDTRGQKVAAGKADTQTKAAAFAKRANEPVIAELERLRKRVAELESMVSVIRRRIDGQARESRSILEFVDQLGVTK